MPPADTVTHRDLAQALGVSETTIKSYRTKFPGFLPVARQGKPVRLHAEALEVCRAIRQHFGEGLSVLATAEALRGRFREYAAPRRNVALSVTDQDVAVPGVSALSALSGELSSRLVELAEAQARSQARIEQLEAEVRNLATLEAVSKSLVADLLSELRATRLAAPATVPVPTAEPALIAEPRIKEQAIPSEPTVLAARRIVTVHGRAGEAASYALGPEPAPEQPFSDLPRPAQDFLDLPVAIRTERGEFLGLPGGLSVEHLVSALEQAGPEPSLAAWFEEASGIWICSLGRTRQSGRELVLERTTTPRGNVVAHLQRLVTNGLEAGPADMQDLLRQLRDGLG